MAPQAEKSLALKSGEGPIGIIMSPSRELARQTFSVVKHFCDHLYDAGYPELRPGPPS